MHKNYVAVSKAVMLRIAIGFIPCKPRWHIIKILHKRKFFGVGVALPIVALYNV